MNTHFNFLVSFTVRTYCKTELVFWSLIFPKIGCFLSKKIQIKQLVLQLGFHNSAVLLVVVRHYFVLGKITDQENLEIL